jgi:adenylate cyclase
MRLILNPGQIDEQSFELVDGETFIGRTPENTVCVLNKSLSRKHARLERQGDRVRLFDLSSKNGTFVGDARVEHHELREGQFFRCGEVLFKLVGQAVAAAPELQPMKVQELRTQFTPMSMDELLEKSSTLGGGSSSALRVKRLTTDPRAAEKLQILLKVSQLLSSPGSIDSLLERILGLVFQILEVDRGAILLVDPATSELRPRVVKSARGEALPEQFYSQRIVDYVRRHSVGALFGDARLDPRLNGAESVVLQSIHGSLCVPLKPKEELLGVLYVDNTSAANRFTDEDLEFITAFGNQAAIALENSLLYKRIEDEAIQRSNYLRFFPPATLKKMELSRGAPLELIETEVTTLFSDISAFTELSSTLQPRQVVELLNEYFPLMAEIVFRNEGTLEKYIGDALMAVWGAPFSHPDDVDRAVRAAVEMQRALAELNAGWRAEGKVELQIHIGINTGRVAAGNIGSERYLQYATIGDATNVASRVCSATPPGGICLTQSTFDRWRDRAWRSEQLPPLQVKGKQEALTLHQLDWRGAGPSGG